MVTNRSGGFFFFLVNFYLSVYQREITCRSWWEREEGVCNLKIKRNIYYVYIYIERVCVYIFTERFILLISRGETSVATFLFHINYYMYLLFFLSFFWLKYFSFLYCYWILFAFCDPWEGETCCKGKNSGSWNMSYLIFSEYYVESTGDTRRYIKKYIY